MRFTVIKDLLDQLHRIIWIFYLRTVKIVLLVNYAMPYWSTEFFKHLQFDVFQVFLLENFLVSCFQLDWALQVLDGGIIAEKTWYFLGPVITGSIVIILFLLSRFAIVVVVVLEGVADGHVFILFLFRFRPSHSVVWTHIIPKLLAAQIIHFHGKILIFAYMSTVSVAFLGIFQFFCWGAAVIGA